VKASNPQEREIKPLDREQVQVFFETVSGKGGAAPLARLDIQELDV
jgi:hypothetical protein